jgi:hypothetical protein
MLRSVLPPKEALGMLDYDLLAFLARASLGAYGYRRKVGHIQYEAWTVDDILDRRLSWMFARDMQANFDES